MNVGAAGCRTQQRNAHSTESRVVRYQWHPWFEQEVWIHQSRHCLRQAEKVLRCGLSPDLDRHSVEVPLWMFDAVACEAMALAKTPVANAAALAEPKSVLDFFRRAKLAGSSHSKPPMLTTSGDADVQGLNPVAPQFATKPVRAEVSRPVVANATQRMPESARTIARAPPLRTRRALEPAKPAKGGRR